MTMLLTHVSVGLLIASFFSYFIGTSYILACWIAVIFSGVQDLDSFFSHRKTLHFPYLSFLFLVFSLFLVSCFYFLRGDFFNFDLVVLASLCYFTHNVLDIFSAGNVLRPWEGETTDKGIYVYLRGEWVETKRYFYYGSKEDLFILFSSGFIVVFYSFYYGYYSIVLLCFSLFFIGIVFYFLKDSIIDFVE